MLEEENKEADLPLLQINESELYPFAKECYELLRGHGHIDIMKEINQLGVIKKGVIKNDGEDPTRDNYVAIQLGLIYRFKASSSSKGLGLAKNVKGFPEQITAADVLQIWVLLFNAGHLPGTFATERAILRCCKKHADIKSLIRDGLPEDQQIRNYFDKICREENIYTFHKILICFFLERYKRDSNKSSLIDILQKSINYYEFGNDEKWEKLKNIFQTIRKLSFVFLDLQYAPCPFYVDLANVLSNIPVYLEELFFKVGYESPIYGTLESLDDLLSKNVYLSAESNREFAWHSKEIENKIENDKKRLISNELYNYLKEYTNFKPKDIKWGSSPNLHILFDVNGNNQLFDVLKRESQELEKKWGEKRGLIC